MLDPRGNYALTLQRHVQRHPDGDAVIFLGDGENITEKLSYGALHARASQIAHRLAARTSSEDRVLLQLPPGSAFVVGFLACFYAGVVAVPAPQMTSERSRRRGAAIIANCEPTAVLTDTAFMAAHHADIGRAGLLTEAHWLAVDGLPLQNGDLEPPRSITLDSLAFLQYTSGSTADPKGVRVTHGNLLANMEMIAAAYGHTGSTPMVSWLPMYHDMGLIGGLLQPLFCGTFTVLIPPLRFIQKPIRWLRAISRFTPHTSGAPNFGYDLCVDRTTPEDRIGLDLSSWKAAFNGAEPVQARTLERFTNTFASFGFRAESHYPNYGLAEATLIVSGGSKKELPVVRRFDGEALETGHAVPSTADTPTGRALVSSGRTILDQTIQIVDTERKTALPEGRVGEIWVHGPNVADGYWRESGADNENFNARLADAPEGAPYLRTGDLGFLLEGELFVTGRGKDLIIHRGRNVYPQDIELAAACHPALPRGASAAFALNDSDASGIVLVHQLDPRQMEGDPESLAGAIRDAVWQAEEIPLDTVILVKPAGIQKTSSGKVMRRAIRAAFLADTLPVIHQSDVRGNAAPLSAESRKAPSTLLNNLREFLAVNLNLPVDTLLPSTALHKIGLDSLDATLLAHRVETAFGVPLPASYFLRGSTIDEVARALAAEGAHGPLPLPPKASMGLGDTAAEKSAIPLTRGQEALYFIHKMAPETAAYNVNVAMHLHASVTEETVARVVENLCRRHPMLRATVCDHPRRPYFKIAKAPGPRPRRVDLSDSNPVEAVRKQGRMPFDVENERLFRATLFRHPEGKILLLSCHHLICDGWSMDILLQELDALLAAETEGHGVTLPPVGDPSRILDLEESALAGSGGFESLLFWRKRLAGAPTQLTLPFPSAQQRSAAFQGDSHEFGVSDGLFKALRRFAQETGTTPFTVLHAAFQTLVHRYTGLETFLIGTVASVHRDVELQNNVGYFVNPIVLRADIQSGHTPRRLVDAVQEMVGESLDHRSLPFNLLVELVNPERRAERSPFIQVAFGLTKLDFRRDKAKRAADGTPYMEPALNPQQEGAYDVNLQLFEIDGALQGHLNFNTAIYNREDMARMANHYLTLLDSFVKSPDMRIADLQLVTKTEQALQDSLGRGPATPMPAGQTLASVPEMVTAQARKTPTDIAVRVGAETRTYAALEQAMNALARQLVAAGIGPGDRVGVYGEGNIALPETCLGIMRARAAYVPLDPSLPTARLAYMAQDCGLKAVVALTGLPARVRSALNTLVLQPSRWDPDIEADLPIGQFDDGAYVIYTSGSTGKPKGVAVPQGSLARRLLWKCSTLGLITGSRVLQSIAPSFDPSVWELFAPLIAGGTVVPVDDQLRRNPARFIQTLQQDDITHFSCVPSLLSYLVETDGFDACRSLRHVITGGEPLSRSLARRFADKSAATLHHFYGPTEATVFCTHYLYPGSGSGSSGDCLPIGRPVSDTLIRVIDREGQPAPRGLPGELYVGGDALADGYINDPATSAERFVADPLDLLPGTRFYRTGDLVRLTNDGMLQFIGRQDAQIKIRGLRIEPGEIENALERFPGIAKAAVVKHRLESGQAVLLAHIADTGEAPNDDALRRDLAGSLPAHMVPALYHRSSSLPTLPSGKIDREALPVPERSRLPAGADQTPPRTETEGELAQIWQDLLGLETVGIRSNFFDLGGHSLMALSLLKRIESRFGVKLSALTIFENPVLASMALVIETRGHTGSLNVETGERFFCVAPGSGDAVRFARLANALAPTIDLIPLVPPSLQEARQLPTLRSLADQYAQQIIAAQPAGPYVIGGFSVGGVLALETAATLKRMGREVRTVVLLDTVYPVVSSASGALFFGLKKATHLFRRAASLMGPWFTHVMEDEGLETHMAITAGKDPQAYTGDVALVMSKTNSWFAGTLFHKWQSVLSRLRIVAPVPGWHGTMFGDRGIDALARRIQDEVTPED
ncbi:MAG: amino acid adenylation domain-containing protein [Magnetospiraceae bacterium]